MKICSICQTEKPKENFHKDKRTKSGLYSACKGCHYYKYQKTEQRREYKKEYEKTEQRREYMREYFKQYRKITQNKVSASIRKGIWNALKAKKAGGSWEVLVGYTVEDLTQHLENQFEAWMTWENYGEWHIDHVKPVSLFKYETAEDIEFKKCWALSNLQPLGAKENRKKYNIFTDKL